MSRSIFLINHSGELTELREQPYDTEALLQRLLADYPGVLSGDSSNDDDAKRWLLIRREIDVPDVLDGGGRWSVDHLFLDQDAVPTLVEVKRSSDTRIRREVVGQMLDYAANAVVYWPVDKIRSSFEERCARQGLDADAEVAQLLGEPTLDDSGEETGVDVEAFWLKAKTNLQAGRVRLVFVADVIPPELRRVVEFLNQQMDPAEVLAIEIRQYLAGGLRTLVPSVIGQTAEAQQRKSSAVRARVSNRQWDEPTYFEELQRTSGPEVARITQEILAWGQRSASRVWFGRGQHVGSFVPILNHNGTDHQLFAVWSSGTIEFYFQWFAAKQPFSDEILRRKLLDRLNAIPEVAIPLDALRRRPSIPLTIFVDEGALAQLLTTFDWCITEIRRTGNVSVAVGSDE